MAAHADRRHPTGQRRAQLEDAVGRRRERVASLVALAGASAAAAAAVLLLAAAGAGREAESGLDSMLIASAGQPHGGALRRRAERISSQRHRRRVARPLDALVARADRAPHRECFQARLVRLHRSRLLRIARTVRSGGPVADSAVARVNRFLWDPGSPLVRRPDYDERFSAWPRQIEVELGLPLRSPRDHAHTGIIPAVPSTDPKLDLIASVPLFAGLDKREIAFLGRLMDEVDIADGKVLTREGARGGEFFIVLDGAIKIERGGNEINRLGRGDFLGEIALIDQGPRTATATAAGPARVMVLTSSAFASMLSQNPGVETKILRVLASRVRDLQPTAAL